MKLHELIAATRTYTQQCSLVDATTLCYLIPDEVWSRKLRQELATKIRLALNKQTIETAPLSFVAMGVYVVTSTSGIALDGDQLAWFIQRLMKSEILPGGPYRDVAHEPAQIVDNAWVYGALEKLEVPLAGLRAFLQKETATTQPDIFLENTMACLAIDMLPSECRKSILQSLGEKYIDTAKSPGSEIDILLYGRLHRVGISIDFQMPKISLPPPANIYLALLAHVTSYNRALQIQKLAVHRLVERFITAQPARLRPILEQLLKGVKDKDVAGEIALLPRMVRQSFSVLQNITAVQLKNLGAANILCWMSYTVYDDFFDNEGSPLLLTAANSAHRASLEFARNAAMDMRVYQQFFDQMDGANAWEIQHARFSTTATRIACTPLPDYEDMSILADRAGGHIAGACMVAQALLSTEDYTRCVEGLKHYLIAKQLNDDLHDWRQDFLAGRITPIVVLLLRDAHLPLKTHTFKAILPQLERVFYDTTFLNAISVIRGECAQAQATLRCIAGYKSSAGIERHIVTILRSCDESVRLQRTHKKFAKAFQTG